MNNLLRRNGFCGIGQKDVGQKNVLLLVLAAVILACEARAGTVVSNLGEETQDNFPIDNSTWLASPFYISAGASDFRLDSIRAPFANAVGDVSTFSAVIYSEEFHGRPEQQLEVLTGQVPLENKEYEFSSSGLTLRAGSMYWLALTSTDADASVQPFFTSSAAFSEDGSWVIDDAMRMSADQGASWGIGGLPNAVRSGSLVYSIQATPVPEPHEYAVFAGIGLIAFGVIRRKMKGGSGAALASC